MRFTDIPMLEGGVPLLGHFRRLRDDRMGLMNRIAELEHELLRVQFPGQTVVAATGTTAIHDVLVTKANSFEKSPVLRTSLYPLAGDGLFTSEGMLWRRQRKLMAPLFRMKELHAYADAMGECARRGIQDWKDGAEIDLARETTRIAMSVAGKTLFDADTFTDADELGEALTTSLEWVNDQVSAPTLMAQARLKTSLMKASHWFPNPLGTWCNAASDALHPPIIWPGARTRELQAALEVLERRVERMIAARRGSQEPTPDLLTQLLNASDEGGAKMTDKQIRDEILTLFIAGHETTASALAWSLYLLAKDRDAYGRARSEADALSNDRVSFEDVKRLPFCLKVFKEALRLYPPIYLFGRQAMDPVEVAGYTLPRGTIVLVSPYTVQRRADVWPDPTRFDPERFSPEAEQSRSREAYIPFSGGARTCIGNHFALLEGPIVLATLLQHAELELPPHAKIVPLASATLRPSCVDSNGVGMPMRVRLRSRTSLWPAPLGGSGRAEDVR